MATRKRKRWPELPKKAYGAGGPIKVVIAVPKMEKPDDEAYGTWDPDGRIITINPESKIEHQWRTYFHEWTHSVLADSGLTQLLPPESEEALCEAFSTARMVELRRSL